MGKIIAAFNMTLDGICGHTALSPDDEVHGHYTQLLKNAGTMLYGRITYQLMEDYWPELVKNPSGDRSMDDFAVAMENIQKIVFSRTLKHIAWDSARLATKGIEEEVAELKQRAHKDVLVGSRSLIIALLNEGLIDEFQIMVHPVIAGNGLPLFSEIKGRIELKLLKTKTFKCGATTLYYRPER